MSFKFLNEGQSGNVQQFTPIDTFIDPVSKIRVSNPSNLIDTDFEYGLQPTKWETVELINNTPAFFSKGGDTTIPDITGITTNAGTREITVTTAFPHNLAVGIPIRVAGTKSVTADGSYIINATPTPNTFTYLCRANQPETISIFDLYSSIITGEFFQGSQISISDAEGITTDGQGPTSTLTVKTENKHGFGLNTPFYFLNLNSTISQEFEAQNNSSISFDPTNSATAQSFDGSNTLLQTPIDLSNSATTSIYENFITSTDPVNSTVTIQINSLDAPNWSTLKFGDPLYYSLSAPGGYFQNNPRGVVFIKNVSGINVANNTATFEVSQIPNGDTIPILANMQGFFQIADQAKTFAGNNIDEQTQIEIPVVVGDPFVFDGGNQGYLGEEGDYLDGPPSSTSTVIGYTGTTINIFTAEGFLDYYVGAMLTYNSDGDDASGLVSGTTYFVTAFAAGQSSGLFTMSVAELPGGTNINVSGGSGTQTFSRIGVAIDKNIIHIRDSNFQEDDMLEYSAPNTGSFGYEAAETQKRFFYVDIAYDEHNYKLNEDVGFRAVQATGGNVILGRYIDTSVGTPGRMGSVGANAQLYTIHMFTAPGTQTFEITDIGLEGFNTIEYLVVGGGGGGGNDMGGGGGGGGVLEGSFVPTEPGTYTITVGNGGLSNQNGYRTSVPEGQRGQDSSAFGVTALGGGSGAGGHRGDNQVSRSGVNGASGGGEAGRGQNNEPGAGTPGQGFAGGRSGGDWYAGSGGGAGSAATNGTGSLPGEGKVSNIMGRPVWFGGGGGKGGYSNFGPRGGRGGGGGGGHWGAQDAYGLNPSQNGVYGNCCNQHGGSGGANTGGGAGGHSHQGGSGSTRRGGSGVVIVRYLGAPANQDQFISATGGTQTTLDVGGIRYAVHAFTDVGTSNFQVLTTSDNPTYNYFEYLIVGGGGGGGNDMGGGGGGGGVLSGFVGLETGIYPVTVGNGGRSNSNGYTTSVPQGSRGEDSSAFGLIALGGGGGAGGHRGDTQTSLPGDHGASGGGAAGRGQGGIAGPGVRGQGNRGGNSGGDWYAGSGGGAGSAATDGTGSLPGDGVVNSILGPSYYWGGGGGKGGYSNAGARGGRGGGGGGGNGGAGDNNGINPSEAGVPGNCCNQHGGSGGVNTGGGAGGHSHQGGSGSTKRGGSGIVVIRYPIGVL